MIDKKTIDFIKDHKQEDVHSLALQTKRYPDIDMPFVVRQIKGRQIAREKIPSWYAFDSIIYPQHISLEQSSSEKTAKYKASLCRGESLVDLTGGLGVDFSFMSRQFTTATYVEKQKELVETARHNYNELGLQNCKLINDEAESYLKEMLAAGTIFIDPARRDTHGRKTVRIEDCTPNLIEIEDLLEGKSGRTIIKLSPMLDITLAINTLRNISEVHVVSVDSECKELLFIKENNDNICPVIHCVNIKEDITEHLSSTKKEEENTHTIYSAEINKYLYEPNASITKAGLYKSVAAQYNLQKLHPNSHLYTSDRLEKDFPGRIFTVNNILTFDKKNIKEISRQIDKANITVRNFPLTVEEIRKRTSIKDGGDLYIFATTSADEQKIIIICEKI